MRFFLYSYDRRDNFDISKKHGVVGCRSTGGGLTTKFRKLSPGDVIVIRNSQSKQLEFFGCCLVKERPYYHGNTGEFPYPDFLWADEQEMKQIIYPHRVRVDFNALTTIDLADINWENLLDFRWKNKKGMLFDKKGLKVFFSKGNFVEEDERFSREQVRAFANLIGVQHSVETQTPIAKDYGEPAEPKRILCMTYRILRDTAIARDVKLLHDYECQICGDTILLSNGKRYAESHHIKPLSLKHNGPDVMANIICVCPNHHVQLDYGVIKLEKSCLSSNQEHIISDEYINYHNTQIYGNH